MRPLPLLLTLFLLTPATLLGQQEPAHSSDEDTAPEHHGHHQHQEHGHHHASPDAEHHHQHGDGVHHDFSDVDVWLARFEGPDRDEYQKPAYVVELMKIEPGMTVVDLGAGTGYFLPYLSKGVGAEGKVLGLDPEPNLVTFMQKRIAKEGWGGCEARQIPLDSPELELGSVDRILIVNTWHHIDNRGAYAARLREALKPGGEVWVVDYTKESPRGPAVEHRLTAEQVIEELAAGGLAGEVRAADLPLQYVVVAR